MAKIDKEGFIHITGRVSRFSKISGKMVPHIQVEEELTKVFCEGEDDDVIRVMVTSVPDAKKGERLSSDPHSGHVCFTGSLIIVSCAARNEIIHRPLCRDGL